jgi:kynurenine 3-monooxygenase
MTQRPGKPQITIVGAGLVGSLLATLLARSGFGVTVFERLADPRVAGYAGGRSINLALAERGLHGLRLAGQSEPVMRLAVMMRGRMVHHRDGHTELLRYGRDDSEVIWSIDRGQLNICLIDAAEAAGARIHFDRRLEHAQFARGVRLGLRDGDGREYVHEAPFAIGADGAGSALRAAMNAEQALGERIEFLGHGYKELEIPPLAMLGEAQREHLVAAGAVAPFAIERNALHIWPRGNHMCIALPNAEGNFTVTLFLANNGEPGFATIASANRAREFFAREFPDALALMPRFDEDFAANPIGVLATLYLDRWHLDGRALLVGDAAHAMVPFHGQGMNCAFEDAVELAELLRHDSADIATTFAEFERRRRPNAEAIMAMALENYVEMRDSVADPDFLLRRELGRVLADRHPDRFMPRYAMVTFTRMPYARAFARGAAQDAILHELTAGRHHVGEVDLAEADRLVNERLALLSA